MTISKIKENASEEHHKTNKIGKEIVFGQSF
jgi:hypothetical protein